MSHTMTSQQIHSLHHLAVALRPDWYNNRCGSTWQTALEANGTPMTLPHAHDFHHAIQALIHYCVATKPDGTHRYRAPNMFPHHGEWWTETRPKDVPAKLPPCEQHGTDYGNNQTCAACWSEIKAGTRPEDHLGEIYEPSTTS